MNQDVLQKVAIAIFSAVFGWVIAQLTTTVRALLYRRKIIRLLHEELNDLDREAARLLYYHARNLQLYGAQGIGEAGMIGLSNPIYVNYYKDALLSLNQSQRISLQLIHGLVSAQNAILTEIEEVNNSVRRDHRENGLNDLTVKGGENLAELTKRGYSNCAIIRWHIDFHLKRKSDPDLSPNTEDHEMYLRYLDSVVKDIQKTIDSGKKIPKEKFEEIYSESHFKPRP